VQFYRTQVRTPQVEALFGEYIVEMHDALRVQHGRGEFDFLIGAATCDANLRLINRHEFQSTGLFMGPWRDNSTANSTANSTLRRFLEIHSTSNLFPFCPNPQAQNSTLNPKPKFTNNLETGSSPFVHKRMYESHAPNKSNKIKIKTNLQCQTCKTKEV
jgi:hypothetical protein